MRYEGRVAVVSGAAKGIGKGIAQILAGEGAKVVVVDRDGVAGGIAEDELRRTGGEATFVECDVSIEGQVVAMVQEVVARYGRIEVLVNNAGIGGPLAVDEATEDDWDRVLGVNLKGVVYCCKHVIPHMQAAGGGAIVNITSIHALATRRRAAPYAASKGAVAALTRSLAVDYAPLIRVNSIAPGWILTPLVEEVFRRYPDPVKQRSTVEGALPLGRLGEPQEVGRAVAFLASDDASFITGAQLVVDGGQLALSQAWAQ